MSTLAAILNLFYGRDDLYYANNTHLYYEIASNSVVVLDIGMQGVRNIIDCRQHRDSSLNDFRWEKDGITLRYPDFPSFNQTWMEFLLRRLFFDVDGYFDLFGVYTCINGEERVSVTVIGGKVKGYIGEGNWPSCFFTSMAIAAKKFGFKLWHQFPSLFLALSQTFFGVCS
jgi:hypothetical protein